MFREVLRGYWKSVGNIFLKYNFVIYKILKFCLLEGGFV